MMRILVTPENLRSLSAQLQQFAGDLQSVEGRVSSALGGLAWEARQKAGVDGQANQARSQARALAAQAEEMARYLTNKAQAFEEADGQGVVGIAQIAESFEDWWHSHPELWRVIPLRKDLWRELGLGEISFTVLPVAGGAAVVGLAGLTHWSLTFSKVEDFGERVWNWLHHKGWKTDGELVAAGRGTATRSRFGELLTQDDESESKKKTKSQATSTSKPEAKKVEPAQVPSAQSEWWKDVPVQSQQGLKYKEGKTAYGCTPTATSMILDYWHAKDPANKTMSAQKLLDVNAGQGVFGATGMSASNVLDEVKGLGYGVTDTRVNSNLDALKEAVSKGPVLAIVKLVMKATGTNHAVVVTGISPDGKQVRINDPWTGQAHTYSWDDFARSWDANFGKDAPKNNFVAIRPS